MHPVTRCLAVWAALFSVAVMVEAAEREAAADADAEHLRSFLEVDMSSMPSVSFVVARAKELAQLMQAALAGYAAEDAS